MGEAVIVAGIGSRRGVGSDEVIAAMEAALREHGLAVGDLSVLATTSFKRHEAGIFVAGLELGLEVVVVETEGGRVETCPPGAVTLTRSALSLTLAGVASVSEAAALGAAGDGARLLGPHLAVGRVTCAIAVSGETP